MMSSRHVQIAVSLCAVIVWLCGDAAQGQEAGAPPHVIFADPQTHDALQKDPVLASLMAQPPVELIEALMPGVNDTERLLEPAQRIALEAVQNRLRDERGVLSFVWIGAAGNLPRAAAENVRLVRNRADGKNVIVFLFTASPDRHAFLLSGPLVSRLGGKEATPDFLKFSEDPSGYVTSPGAAIVAHVLTIHARLENVAPPPSPLKVEQSATPEPTRRPGAAHLTAETAPPAVAPQENIKVEPREILIIALAASVGGLLVGLIVSLVHSHRRRSRARNIMSSHFVRSAEAPRPVSQISAPTGTVDYSMLANAMPDATTTIQERLGLAQKRLIALRESARQLQETVNASTLELLAHIEREVHELEDLRRALQG